MSRERLVSIVAGRASKYVTLKTPSKIIPFRGSFPLLQPYQAHAYFNSIRETENLEDLPKEFQDITEKGNRIALFEEGFKRYLSSYNISVDDFLKMKNVEKSDKLIDWMNKDCIDFSQLKIE
jgi:hypothetical protein